MPNVFRYQMQDRFSFIRTNSVVRYSKELEYSAYIDISDIPTGILKARVNRLLLS